MRKVTKIITGAIACTFALGAMSTTTVDALTTSTTPGQAAESKTFALTADSLNERTLYFALEDATAYVMLDSIGKDIEFSILKDDDETVIKSFKATFTGLSSSDTDNSVTADITYQSLDKSSDNYSDTLDDGQISIKTSNVRTYDDKISLKSFADLETMYTVNYSGSEISPISSGWNSTTVPLDMGSANSRLSNKFFTSIEIEAIVDVDKDMSDDEMAEAYSLTSDSFGELKVLKTSGAATKLALAGTESSTAKSDVTATNSKITSDRADLVNYYDNFEAITDYSNSGASSVNNYIDSYANDTAVQNANISTVTSSTAEAYKYLIENSASTYLTKAALSSGVQTIINKKAQALAAFDSDNPVQSHTADTITNDLDTTPYKVSSTKTSELNVTTSVTLIDNISSINSFLKGKEDATLTFTLSSSGTSASTNNRLGLILSVSRVKDGSISTTAFTQDNIYLGDADSFTVSWNELTKKSLLDTVYEVKSIGLYASNSNVGLKSLTINIPQKDKLESKLITLAAGESISDTAAPITETTASSSITSDSVADTTEAADNPSTGNSPIALAVIPVAMTASFFILRSKK